MNRQCCRTACTNPAVATLTFVYADSTAVLGPLATQATPGAYDLCADHARTTSPPQGWEIIRLHDPESLTTAPSDDDLMALADAIRNAGFADAPETPDPDSVVELGRRGHLRIIADASGKQNQ